MNDFLKKVKSVFIVEDEPQTSDAQQSTPANEDTSTAPDTPAAASGSVNNKFLDVLAAALEKNNQQGFDYFEFRQALKNLSKMSMDEQTRFQSAFAMAQTMGVTPAKLVESAQFYLQVLTSEQARFNEAHAQQRAKLIGSREDDVKNIEAQIQQKSQQIAQLTKEIEAGRQQSEQIRQEISDSTVKIESTRADFEATFNSVTAQLQDDVAKIQQYLK